MEGEGNIPVAALDSGPILRSSAVAGLVTDLIAIAALDDLTVFGHVISGTAFVASTGFAWLLALLSAVTDAMTILITQHAVDLDTIDDNDFVRAIALHVTHLAAVGAFGDATIDGQTSLRETLEVGSRSLGPLLEELWALRFLGEVEADGVLLTNLTLKVDNGPGLFDSLLQADEIDLVAALAELLLHLQICEGRASLGEDLDTVSEVIEVFLVGGFLEHGPGLTFGHVWNVGDVDDLSVLALNGIVALLEALTADLRLLGAVASLMTCVKLVSCP